MESKKDKFNKIDRMLQQISIEEKFDVLLSRIGKRQKYFEDENEYRYILLGGTDLWHGIPIDIINDLKENNKYAIISIAIKKIKLLEVYYKDIGDILENLNKLNIISSKQYTFNLEQNLNKNLYIKEIPSIYFDFIANIEYSDENLSRAKDAINFEKSFKNLSKDKLFKLRRVFKK